MSFSYSCFVGKINNRKIRKEILHFSQKIIFKRIRIEIGNIQSDITKIFFDNFYHITKTIRRYRQSKKTRFFWIDDSKMDTLVFFSSSENIVSNKVECFEIKKLRSIDSNSIYTQFITQIDSSIYLFIIQIVWSLYDLDRQLIFLRKLFDIINLPWIKIFPNSKINTIKSCFFYEFKNQIQSISRKRICTKQAIGLFDISCGRRWFSLFYIKKEVLFDRWKMGFFHNFFFFVYHCPKYKQYKSLLSIVFFIKNANFIYNKKDLFQRQRKQKGLMIRTRKRKRIKMSNSEWWSRP